MHFYGYSVPSKVYKLYNLVSGKFIVSRDVKFNEAKKWAWDKNDAAGTQLVKDGPEVCEPVECVSPLSSKNNSSSIVTPSKYDHTPKKFRPLTKIYDTCSFALNMTEPTYFEEAAVNKE